MKPPFVTSPGNAHEKSPDDADRVKQDAEWLVTEFRKSNPELTLDQTLQRIDNLISVVEFHADILKVSINRLEEEKSRIESLEDEESIVSLSNGQGFFASELAHKKVEIVTTERSIEKLKDMRGYLAGEFQKGIVMLGDNDDSSKTSMRCS